MPFKPATWCKRLVLASVLAGSGAIAGAHDLTLDECLEGSEFIQHAAMSRDNGITREAFLQRMESDLRAILAYPPHLRWFVQDTDDEVLLTTAAQGVFDVPREPSIHQSEFLERCVERIGASADAAPANAALDADQNTETYRGN